MAAPYMCGIIDPTNPTFVKKAITWNPYFQAYFGMYSDQVNIHSQGCRGKQLPGDPSTFYFIVVEYDKYRAIVGMHLVKAKYDIYTDTFTLIRKQLPGIQGAIDIPKPNQLAVNSAGRVFMPIGSYDSPIQVNKSYYLDITGTLSDDPSDWTITARYCVDPNGGDITEGTFCMSLNKTENKICFGSRNCIIGEGNIFQQDFIECDLDGSNPNAITIDQNITDTYYPMPLNIECSQTLGHYYCVAIFEEAWGITDLDYINTLYYQHVSKDYQGSVSVNSNGNIMVTYLHEYCPGNSNPCEQWHSDGAGAFTSIATVSMLCPQKTPTHNDTYLDTDEPWTASGIWSEISGSVRQAATPDRESTANYNYACTGCPR